MAIVRAVKSGNWSDVTVWNTGALPTSADDVYSNTFTVTIDISPTVLRISNAATTGVTAGGNFVPTNGVSLTCTGAGVVAGSATCISYGLSANQSFTVNGNIQAGTSSSAHGIATVAAGTLNIVGNVSGGSTGSSFAYGITCGASSTATINVTGNVNGGTGSSWTSGIDVQGGSPVISVTGAVTASSGSTSYGIFIKGGTITVIGQLIANGTHAFYSDSASASYTLQHTGSAQASSTGSGVASLSTNASHVLSGPFLVASNGFNAVFVPRWFWANSNVTPTYYQIRTANLATIRPLYTADSVGGNPATSNVRSGTVYGPAGELTGTCAVPPAGSVALGVPVDNTTGTAYITANDIATALSSASAVTLNQQTSSLTTPGSIGERLKLASTVATTAQQLSDALSNE